MDLFRNCSMWWIQSALSSHQQFISHESVAVALFTQKRHSQISNSSLIQKKQRDSADCLKSAEAARGCQSTPRSSVIRFNEEGKATQFQRVISQAQRRPAMSGRSDAGRSLGYTYTLSKHHMCSQASAPVKYHVPFCQSASRKTPRVFSAKHLPTRPLQQNIIS